MSDGSEIRERVFRFACGVLELHDHLAHRSLVSRELSRQLVRAATSIGANVPAVRELKIEN
jgi:hypothetical protein